MSLHTSVRRTTAKLSSTTFICNQCRHATLLRRPKRPYTFTQLMVLTDGSTFTHRTTSPVPVYRSTRDTRNAPLWNPSSEKLLNVEEDEAGRLAAFRSRFGRSWDATSSAAAAATSAETAAPETEEAKKKAEISAAELAAAEEEDDNLLDLISSFGQGDSLPGAKKKGGK
ncbi:hypothetical protein AJ80_01051 [Polytolypa hystricis UAMH7299]|uniref:Ribosomal protein bL31m N-terminal domain-containing protein n=1 Tax=Polytolypa hystricis (strain UAMH7299) TaxID=1447883 RepID=A0A2B7Z271_POLH7|nr:hypothetical protein AJ80_01051 [Polytolypa hystricis UAMH7299]